MLNKKISQWGLLLLMAAVMSGCAGMNDDFSCKKVDGIAGCNSMTDINNMVSDGKISSDSDGHITRNLDGKKSSKKSQGDNVNKTSHVSVRHNSSFAAVSDPSMPQRSQEKTARMTIFAYKDSNGNFHATHNVYTVVKHAHWVNP